MATLPPVHNQAQHRAAHKRIERAKNHASRELYGNHHWRKFRLTILAREPLCRECLKLGIVEAATDVDHIVPMRGDTTTLYDPDAVQSLCGPCHSRKTARENMGA